MSNLCIIPARGGSKRIPKKNIKDFLGKPIIAYSIQVAKESNLFDEIMVSTDDKEIAEISIKLGAKVPVFRSPENSDDFSTTSDVLIEVLEKYKQTGINFENCCCIYPTSPLINKNSLIKAYNLLESENFQSVFPVVKFSYPIYRALQMNDSKVSMIWEENLNKRSQDLPSAYHDSGQFYWFTVSEFFKSKKLFTENSGAIVLKETEVQDIDNETDWKLAELKYKLMKHP